MSPRRRIQTDVPETEDSDGSLRDGGPGRTGTENVPQTEGQDGCALVIRSSESECLFYVVCFVCACGVFECGIFLHRSGLVTTSFGCNMADSTHILPHVCGFK